MPSFKTESKLSNDNAIPYNTVEPVYIFQQPLQNMKKYQILLLRAVSGCVNLTEICGITIDLAKIKEALMDCSLIAMRNTYGKSFMQIRSFLCK